MNLIVHLSKKEQYFKDMTRVFQKIIEERLKFYVDI